MNRKIDEAFYNTAPSLNHPDNLQFARELVRELKIEKGIPRKERIKGEISYRKTWFGLSRTEDMEWSLHVELSVADFLTVRIDGFSYDADHGDAFDEEKTLVHLSFDKLMN